MDRWLAMSVFSTVVELGSFARAADRLGISTSAASRHVGELEARLGTRLLHRTTRRLSLTESGQQYHERCVQLLADLDDAEQGAGARTTDPWGTIRLTCAVRFGIRHVAPAIDAFIEQHPHISFDFAVADRIVDLVQEGVDLAIRIGGTGGENLVARKIGDSRLVVCAAPRYLKHRGTPKVPADLKNHNCLTYEYLGSRQSWKFRDRNGRDQVVRVAGNMHANNGELLAAAAAQGLGIVMEPDFIVGSDCKAKRLVRILDDFAPPAAPIYAIYPSRRHLPAKVRLFIDFLAARFAGTQFWD